MLPPPHFWTSIQPLLTWGRGRPPARGGVRLPVRACVRGSVLARDGVLGQIKMFYDSGANAQTPHTYCALLVNLE